MPGRSDPRGQSLSPGNTAVRTLCQACWRMRAPRGPPPTGLPDPPHKQHAGRRTRAWRGRHAGRCHHTGTLLGLSRQAEPLAMQTTFST
ncbi:unnamed protein product [Gulo gulo]|uniref:Uncharacterized protein n=1 Tax=Gulo gulo TaxID=48420 RepID=A0A9X9LEW3_GULGU|nr:unnamed protein product [Gulo gulo]